MESTGKKRKTSSTFGIPNQNNVTVVWDTYQIQSEFQQVCQVVHGQQGMLQSQQMMLQHHQQAIQNQNKIINDLMEEIKKLNDRVEFLQERVNQPPALPPLDGPPSYIC